MASLSSHALPDADADLVRVCHAFAEAEWRNWWRYITTPADLADAQDRNPDWTTLERIQTTPATTPAGWQAKALALSSWDHAAYDDEEAQRDGATTLLAGLLRDMVAPARAEILARCAAEYGPLPEGYTEDGRWISPPSAAVQVAAPLPLHVDVDLLAACVAFKRAELEVARLERTADDDVFEPAVAVMHAAAERVSGVRGRPAGGLPAKAIVWQIGRGSGRGRG